MTNTQESEKKVFVVDTNVLIHDPKALKKFGDNIVVVPIWVIEELDRRKSDPGEKGRNSREVSRFLKKCIETEKLNNNSLKNGLSTESGGKIFIDYNGSSFEDLPVGLERTNDNRIILIAKKWKDDGKYKNVIVVSKDTNLFIKAEACGIEAEDYTSDKVVSRVEEIYSGLQSIDLPYKSKGCMTDWYRKKEIAIGEISGEFDVDLLNENQCCIIRAAEKSILAVFKKSRSFFKVVEKPEKYNGAVKAKNSEQLFAYSMLTDPDILLVSLVGKAGTGKTLMALLAGHDQLDKEYNQILVYRPNIELGREIGFLPGDLKEKFEPWMQPIIDNLNLVVNGNNGNGTGKDKELKTSRIDTIKDYMAFGKVEISPINYIRGRSIHKCFIIIDEAQNLTPHEVKSLATRVGKGSKMVLTGDIAQIDNPYLDSLTNGLSYLVQRFKDQRVYGHITMEKGERSELAELAANLL